ncbi:MAG TPA: inner membrane-spanning protein YciB [Steroidobacteraceae bacterium]|nr:inner membrane-spanning protein YciB [Steroidobacteraceae bacterium]
MQAVLDFAPLLAFGVAYHFGGIYVATGTLMAAMAALLGVDWLRLKRIPPMHALSALLVFLFGGITLWLRSPIFLKWKPTILLWLLALGFVLSTGFGARPLLQRMLEPTLPDARTLSVRTWVRASWGWGVFYALLGALNLLVAYHAPEAVWVNFKIYGLTAATMLFAVVSSVWLLRQPAPGPAEP